jgi:hypothetical protein
VHIFRHLFVCFQNSVYMLGEFHQNRDKSRSTIFPGILFFVIFRPRDIQEYISMFSIALEWTVNSISDHQIAN